MRGVLVASGWEPTGGSIRDNFRLVAIMRTKHQYARAALGLFATAALLCGPQALAEVKKQDFHPGTSSTVRFADAAYTLTCWQEGTQVLENEGVGNVALSRDFVDRTLTISSRNGQGPVLTIFSTDTAICRLQTRQGAAR